jgi:acyl-CoA-dependent ceramide synthase
MATHNGAMSRTQAVDMQAQKMAVTPKRRKTAPKKVEEGLLASLCTLVAEHQIGTSQSVAPYIPQKLMAAGISINILSLLFLTHIIFPKARSRTAKFFRMSYYNRETQMYGCGTDDLPYVVFWSVVFTGLRVVIMEYLLDPLARLGGLKTKKGLDRFKEQAWLIVYYTGSWSLGMVRTYPMIVAVQS